MMGFADHLLPKVLSLLIVTYRKTFPYTKSEMASPNVTHRYIIHINYQHIKPHIIAYCLYFFLNYERCKSMIHISCLPLYSL